MMTIHDNISCSFGRSVNSTSLEDGLSGSRAPTRLVVLVVDVVSAVLECRALPDAASPFLSEPPAGALGAKYLRRIEAQPQIRTLISCSTDMQGV